MNKSQWNEHRPDILRHDSSLLSQYNGATERVIKSLFLISSGGVITVLAYLYKGALSDCVKSLLVSSLTLFLFSLVLAFVVVIVDYFICLFRLERFHKQIEDENKSPEDVDELTGRHPYPKIKVPLLILGVISAITILLGITLGLLGFYLS